jgi:hypothetical protein
MSSRDSSGKPTAEGNVRGREDLERIDSLTPYNFSFNDPVTFTDANGADPWWQRYTDMHGAMLDGFHNAVVDGGGGGAGAGDPFMNSGYRFAYGRNSGFGSHWSDRFSGWNIAIDFNQLPNGTYFTLDFTNGHLSNFTQYSEEVAMGDSFGAMIGASQWVSEDNTVGVKRLWGNNAGTYFSPNGNPAMVSTGKKSPVNGTPDSAIPVYGDFQRASYWAGHDDMSRAALYGALGAADLAGIAGLGKALLKSGARYFASRSHTIYRVVSKGEAADVLANGFRQAPINSKISSYEGKLFWSNSRDAKWFKNWSSTDDVILKIKVDNSFIYENGYDAGRLFYFVGPDRLNTFNSAIKVIK